MTLIKMEDTKLAKIIREGEHNKNAALAELASFIAESDNVQIETKENYTIYSIRVVPKGVVTK